MRFNTKTRSVEMKTSPHTKDTGALQKGADFVSAFMLGFEVQDAVALGGPGKLLCETVGLL